MDVLDRFDANVARLKTCNAAGVSELEREYQAIRERATKYKASLPNIHGLKEENRKKNRYRDIIPFDHNRVVLPLLPDDPSSDYIQGNYINNFHDEVAYIATQGPLPNTVDDFWRMVWADNIQAVIMLAKVIEMGKKKCERYWPTEGETKLHGGLKIKFDAEANPNDDYCVRTFKVTNEDDGEERRIVQFQYVSWPDHGVPESPLSIMELVGHIRNLFPKASPPLVLHCSAGCGRTGTVILIDIVWRALLAGVSAEDIDVHSLLEKLRRERQSMVQTKDQYMFCFTAVRMLLNTYLSSGKNPKCFDVFLKERGPAPSRPADAPEESLYMSLAEVSAIAKAAAGGNSTSPSGGGVASVVRSSSSGSSSTLGKMMNQEQHTMRNSKSDHHVNNMKNSGSSTSIVRQESAPLSSTAATSSTGQSQTSPARSSSITSASSSSKFGSLSKKLKIGDKLKLKTMRGKKNSSSAASGGSAGSLGGHAVIQESPFFSVMPAPLLGAAAHLGFPTRLNAAPKGPRNQPFAAPV